MRKTASTVRVASLATALALAFLWALSLPACSAPERVPAGLPPPVRPQDPQALANLYRGGRLAELAERVARSGPAAEKSAPVYVALLTAAQGNARAGADLLAQVLGTPAQAEDLCVPLHLAQVRFYQLGDPKGALQALDRAGDFPGCAPDLTREAANALRARLLALLDGPAFSVEGLSGEQALPIDPVAANAGYLAVRVVFDHAHSAHFLLGTGIAEPLIDAELARSLRLKVQTERPMPVPAGDVPYLGPASDGVRLLPTTVLRHFQLGLLTVRAMPAAVAELAGLRDRFRRLVSRTVELGGILPIHRLLPRGYLRLTRRATELRVALDGQGAGPCRLQHPYRSSLYQIGGVLHTQGALPGTPPLFLGLDLAWRRTTLADSLLRYSDRRYQMEAAEQVQDVARPALTEPVATQAIRDAELRLGEAELHLRHVPLRSTPRVVLQEPREHGVVGLDVPGEFDVLIDVGEGQLYLAPPERARCGT